MSGLLVPADLARPLALRAVADSAVSISDLLGGVLLDDAPTWYLGGGGCALVYQAEDRAGLPVNQRLAAIATRLGVVDRAFHAAARGDALILGATGQGRDTDVPDVVAAAADRCGYQIAPATPAEPAYAGTAASDQTGYQNPVQPGGPAPG
jgi:hypothetical protein